MSSLGLYSILKHSAFTLGRQLIAMVIQLVTVVIVARVLGPEGNGQYTVVLLVPTVLVTLLNLGIGSANIFHLGAGKVSIPKAFHITFLSWLILSLVGVSIGLAGLYIGAVDLFPGIGLNLLLLSLIIFPFGLLHSFNLSLLQGLQKFREYNFASLAQPVVTLILVIIAFSGGYKKIEYIIAIYVVALIVAIFLSLHFIGLNNIAKKNTGDYSAYFGRALNYGIKVHISNILAFINYKADIFLINYFLNPAAVGIYVIAVLLSEKLWLLSQSVSTILLPRLSQLETEENLRKKITPIICRCVLATTFLGCVLLGVLSYPIVLILFGDEYSDAVVPLAVLLPGILAGSGAKILANDIAARGRPELNMHTSWIVVVVNVTGNVVLIPIYGIVGAAIATSIAYILNLFLRLIIYARLTGNSWIDSVIIKSSDVQGMMGVLKR